MRLGHLRCMYHTGGASSLTFLTPYLLSLRSGEAVGFNIPKYSSSNFISATVRSRSSLTPHNTPEDNNA